MEVLHWLLTITGAKNESGVWYGFWSGFGGSIPDFLILGSIIGLYMHHNCAVKGCPRIGHHPVEGTHYKTCHKHATLDAHKVLQKKHRREWPDMHELLSGSK